MRTTSPGSGQIYWGQPFSESNSRVFSVSSDGRWHNYRIVLDSPASKTRFRLDPGTGDGEVTLAWLRIEAFTELPKDAWATPTELRDKKMIGGGLYTVYGEETAITPRYLAEHPEFAAVYPFDGIVLPAVLDEQWVASLGLTKLGNPLRPKFLNELLWNKIRIPQSAVAQTLDDLKSMQRGPSESTGQALGHSLTDNFLIYGMVDGARGLKTPDLTNDNDWEILKENAKLAARICREGRLKGFWLDTEQYGHYRWRTQSGTPEFDPDKPQGHHFPLGLDSPEVLRRRGEDWIKAVQAEFPEIKIMTTFAWSPDSLSYGPLTGVIPFLDGVLAGIEAPGQIIHAHENTFYFGHAKGTTHTYATENGFPGDRARFDSARAEIRGWRSLSNHPEKYDLFVQVGMAAWVEDHPWNVSEGWPLGTKASLWSNLPLALAYSDEYVWVWAEHTKYGQPQMRELNPFLASINNQTLNAKHQPIASFIEDFSSDPLKRRWYFDFDMLDIGRKAEPNHKAAVMRTEAIPYQWLANEQSLVVGNGSSKQLVGQRQRFVRSLDPQASKRDFRAAFEFEVSSLGSNPNIPIVLGLFHSEQAVAAQSLTIQINNQGSAKVILNVQGKKTSKRLELPEGIKPGELYRFEFDLKTSQESLTASLFSLTGTAKKTPIAAVKLPMGLVVLDELGIAFAESNSGSEHGTIDYRYLLRKAEFAN